MCGGVEDDSQIYCITWQGVSLIWHLSFRQLERLWRTMDNSRLTYSLSHLLYHTNKHTHKDSHHPFYIFLTNSYHMCMLAHYLFCLCWEPCQFLFCYSLHFLFLIYHIIASVKTVWFTNTSGRKCRKSIFDTPAGWRALWCAPGKTEEDSLFLSDELGHIEKFDLLWISCLLLRGSW